MDSRLARRLQTSSPHNRVISSAEKTGNTTHSAIQREITHRDEEIVE